MEILETIRLNCVETYDEQYNRDEIPFSLYFMGNIISLWQHTPLSGNQMDEIHAYLNDYFLKHYKPQQIPKLFAIISCRFSDIDRGFSSFYSASEYIEIYKKQLNKNKLAKLSLLFDKMHPEEASFEGFQYMTLGYSLIKNGRFKAGIPMISSSINFFVNNNKSYSVYLSTLPIESMIDFLMILIKYDYNFCRKYQYRYKILSRYLLKSFKMFDSYLYSEPVARSLTLLAFYYSHCCNQEGKMNDIKTKKYALKSIKYMKQKCGMGAYKFLLDAYDILYVAERSLCNFERCIAITNIEKKLNDCYIAKLHPEMDQTEIIKERMKYLPEIHRFVGKNKTYQRRYKQGTNTKFWNDNREFSQKNISNYHLKEWIEYIKNDKCYRIIKNICCLKECNLCHAKNYKLLLCKRCKITFYCTRKHQKIDWNNNHRNDCKYS